MSWASSSAARGPCEASADLTHVATIAAKEDERIGVAVARALHRVGPEGVVTIEEAGSPGIEVEFVEGMHVENGHFSPYLIQDTQRMETVFDDPYILLTNRPIVHVQDLMPTLDAVMKSPRPLIIFAEKVDGAALGLLVQNNQHGTLKAVAVRAPGFGHRRIAHLHDLAAFTGGQVIAEEAGLTLADVTPETFGTRAPGGHHRGLDRAGGGRRHRRGIEARLPDPDRARAGDPGHRHRGPARAAGQALEQPGGDPRGRRHGARAQGEVPPHRGRGCGDPRGGQRGNRRRRRDRAAARRRRRSTTPALEGDYLRGAEVIRAVLAEPLYWVATNAGYDGQAVIDQVRAMPDGHGLNALDRVLRRPVRRRRDRPAARDAR